MPIKERIVHLLKHNAVIQATYRVTMSTVFKTIGLFVKTDDRLVLMNGHGYKYNDNPRTIFRKMDELGLTKKYHVVWALNDPDAYDIPHCKKIKMDTLEYFLTALKAKYWVSCVNIERGLKFKKRNTIYMNTWHGAAINLCGNAVSGRHDFHWEHINYFCSCGRYDRKYFGRDLNLRQRAILDCGYPRHDELYAATPEKVAEIRKKLGLPKDKKVILYAPTWRETTDGGASYQLTPPIDWKRWKDALSDQYIILLRTHPYTTKLMDVDFDDFVRNFTEYPEVNELLMAADVLISDYSSIILDYCILGKPLFCFGYDYDQYKKERGFYYDLEKELPHGVQRTEDELLEQLSELDYEKSSAATRKFRDRHMEYGGNATLTCINKLFKTHYK